MKKIFHLSSCSTCQRILAQLNTDGFTLQDIKQQNISESELDFIAEKMGGYEKIFSKRAMKYRSMGLNNMDLTEDLFKSYMLQEYTFLKRPFVVNEGEVFVGNSKKEVEKMINSLK